MGQGLGHVCNLLLQFQGRGSSQPDWCSHGSASIHDSASITGSASKQTRVLTGAYGTESNPNAAKQNHGTTFSLETEPTFISWWMPRGKACHFSHDSSSIHDSTSHERTRAQAEPQNEVEPSGPPQAQAEPWLPHRPNKLFFKSAGEGQRAAWPKPTFFFVA